MYFAFKRTSGQLNSKNFRRVMTRAEQAYGLTYGFYFWIGSQVGGITFTIHFFQVQLDWSRRNLSLPTEHLFGLWLSLLLSTRCMTFTLRFNTSFLFDF